MEEDWMLKSPLMAAALVVAGSVASPAALLKPSLNAQPEIVLIAGGCGPAFHRDPFGTCVPNRRAFFGAAPLAGAPVRLPRPCPRGYHRDPDPARPICYPNL